MKTKEQYMLDRRVEENNLILKTLARIKINSLIIEIENLTQEQLKNKTILEAYKDSLNNALSFYEFSIIHDLEPKKQQHIQSLIEKLQLKILSLELDEISSHKPPVIVRKNDASHNI